MIDQSKLRAMSRRIVEEFQPDKVVLFGSHASGTAKSDSDADFLVILSFRGKASRKAAEILDRVNPSFPVDLIVRTPEQVRRRLALGDCFLRDVLENGRILYERTHAGVGA